MCLAVPGRIESIHGDAPLERRGRVDFGGVFREIQLAFVPEARPGDWVLAHAGLAISVLDEAEAERVLAALEAADEAILPAARAPGDPS